MPLLTGLYPSDTSTSTSTSTNIMAEETKTDEGVMTTPAGRTSPRGGSRGGSSHGAGGGGVGSAAGGFPLPLAPAVITTPTPQTFTRVPGDISMHVYLDYTQKTDLQLFKDNSVQLPTKFDGAVANLKVFAKELRDHVDKAGWKALIDIPVDGGSTLDLLLNYAQIPLKKVKQHVRTWAGVQGSRNNQSSAMMYQCISASLSASTQLEIVNLQDEYTINGLQDGVVFF